jgi:hypothetical protein
VALAALLSVGLPGLAAELASEVLFHASFDHGLDADRALGDAVAREVGTTGSAEGIWGKGVVVGPNAWLEYALEGNLNQAGGAGSIELWVKPLDWDGAEPKEATFFTAEYLNPAGAPELAGLFRLYSLPHVGRLTFIGGPYPDDRPERRVTVQAEVGGWQRGQWHHLVVTWDGFSLALYVDGELARRDAIRALSGSGENPRFVPPLGRVFTLGGKPWSEGGRSAIDEVAIYRSALLPEDVLRQFRRGAQAGGAPEPAAAVPAVQPGPPGGKPVAPGPTPGQPRPSPRTLLAVPLAGQAPTVDGVLDGNEWAGASATNAFVEILTPDARLGRYDNRLHLCVAGQSLYLGLVSEFRAGVPPTAEAQSNGGNVFQDDCFEIHLSSPAAADRVAKYDVNAAGNLDHYQAKPTCALTPTRAVAAAQVLPGKWSCEVAVPLAEIGTTHPAAVGDRYLIQVVRSYKEGSVAQRSNAQRTVGESALKEEYVGFPWNLSFLDVDHYAELVLVAAPRFVHSSVDAGHYARQGELRFEGLFGPAWPPGPNAGQLVTGGPGTDAVVEPLGIGSDGRCVLARTFPEETTAAVLSFPEALCLVLPLARRATGLRIGHTIFSYNNTLEVTVDVTDAPVPSPAEAVAEVVVRDAQGQAVAGERISPFARSVEKRPLSIAGLAAGRYTIDCSLSDHAGNAVASASRPFQVFRELPGQGNRLGITDEAPAPWTPVEVTPGHQIGVWGRTYDFGSSILPRQVVILGRPILSAPVDYELQLEGEPARRLGAGELALVSRQPGWVTIEGNCRDEGVEVRHRLTIEFDGMVRCDAQVAAGKPIRKLALCIPVREDRAKLFHAAAWRGKFTSQILTPLEVGPTFRWSSLYLYPVVLLADMQGGLSWFAGSDRTWVVDRAREKLVATPEGMRVSLVDTDSATVTQLSVTYGLQAFPTRPVRPDWREFGRVREAKWLPVFTPDNRNEQQQGGLVPEAFFRQLMAGGNLRRERALLLPFGNFPRTVADYTALAPEVHAFGLGALEQLLQQKRDLGLEFIAPYLTPTYCSEAIPEWQFYWSNWTAIPKARFDEDGESAVCAANAQWRDFWLQSFHDYAKRYGIKAVFHDMAGTYAEEGTLNGLGYTRDGVRYPEYPVWETREVFKRAYILHRQLFPEAMCFMNYGDFTPPVHSFADFLLAAERYEKEGRADRSIYEFDGDGNLSSFTYQTSLPFGPKAMHNGWLKYRYAMEEREPTVHMYGLVLLHDLVQWNINEHPEVRTAVHALKKRFGIGYEREVAFLPYWEYQGKYRTDSPDIVTSFYRNGPRLLAVVVNKSMRKAFQGTVELATQELGIDSIQSVELFDPLPGSYTSVPNEGTPARLRLTVDVGPTLFKVLLVN